MQHLPAVGALGTNAAPFQGPIVVPQGLWHGHVKAMPTVLRRRAVANSCLLCLLTPTKTPRPSPWLGFLPGSDKPISLIPSLPRFFYAVLRITEVLVLQEEY